MKALVWEAARSMALREEREPVAPADEILVKVGHAGICGSELSGYLGHNALRVPPLIMGHEFAGEIVALGPMVPTLRPDLTIGSLVTVNPLWYCGDCEQCFAGFTQLCSNRRLLGAHRPGAFAEYISAPAKLALLLPEGMDTRTGALTEPVGCAVRIAELADDVTGLDCLIIGAGPIGLLSLQMLQICGAERVFIAELDRARLQMGCGFGRHRHRSERDGHGAGGAGGDSRARCSGEPGCRRKCCNPRAMCRGDAAAWTADPQWVARGEQCHACCRYDPPRDPHGWLLRLHGVTISRPPSSCWGRAR